MLQTATNIGILNLFWLDVLLLKRFEAPVFQKWHVNEKKNNSEHMHSVLRYGAMKVVFTCIDQSKFKLENGLKE